MEVLRLSLVEVCVDMHATTLRAVVAFVDAPPDAIQGASTPGVTRLWSSSWYDYRIGGG